MRDLFISEQRYIRNILWHWTRTELKGFEPVVSEYYESPRSSSGIRFNNDYILQFVSPDELDNFKSYSTTILPNALGADVFLTVDKDTLRPLRTELLAGEAFSINYYKEYVRQVEDRLKQLSRPVRFKDSAYSRIFIIENDICFLVFPNDEIPVIRGEKRLLYADSASAIACLLEDGRVACIEGWIHTSVRQTDRRLVATAKRGGADYR